MQNSNCHGQCYLMQKIKDKQENEQKNFNVHFQESSIELANILDLPKAPTSIINHLTYPEYRKDMFHSNYTSTIFRPPVLV